MTKPFASVALLALALAIAPGSADAQSIRTSKGVRTLPLTLGYKQESQYAAALRVAEGIAQELLVDATSREMALGSVAGDVAGLNEEVRREQAEYERAKAIFVASDSKYRSDLSAYEQRQAALAADVQRQRDQAAALQAQPSAPGYASELTRLNDWANQLARQQADLQAEGQRLQQEHDRVEAERARLAEHRLAAEAKLKERRDRTVQVAGAKQEQRAEVYQQLRVVVDYLHRTRAEASKLTGRPPASSSTLQQAEARLQRYEKEQASK